MRPAKERAASTRVAKRRCGSARNVTAGRTATLTVELVEPFQTPLYVVATDGLTTRLHVPPASVSTVASAVNDPLANRCAKSATVSLARPLATRPDSVTAWRAMTVAVETASVRADPVVMKTASAL